nr:hypothetical protein [Torque teno midi virus]
MSAFFRPTKYNGDTKNQLWLSAIGDIHDSFCGCDCPFAHLLDSIFPPGHIDRNKPINYIIQRDIQQCPSGGPEEENHGLELGDSAATVAAAAGPPTKEESQDITDEDLAALLAAAEEENTRYRASKEKEKSYLPTPKPRGRERRDPKLPPLAMPRQHITRRNTDRPPAAHPPAESQAAAAQAQHPDATNRIEKEARLFETTNRQFRVEPFKDGFEKETERELAIIFHRPPRYYKNDPPFYPWLPPTPLVNFNLNYNC